MSVSIIIEELKAAAGFTGDGSDGELVGIFQAFRPDGLPDIGLFDSWQGGSQFAQRVQSLYAAVSNSRRADGLKDAYFIVRNPPMLHAEHAEALAADFMDGLHRLAQASGIEKIQRLFDPLPRIRVLEGKPPKHPRAKDERADLLDCMQDLIPALVDSVFDPDSLGAVLSEALYFTACDPSLRDFLRWPLLHADKLGQDPFLAYFQLWKHGIKYRVFRNDQIDFYLPWRSTGQLLDAGQFAGQG